mgnify:CR=1 FL=1
MQTVSSYGVELRKQNIPVRQTLEIYRSAVCYLTEIYEQVWEELGRDTGCQKGGLMSTEHLVHTTKKNPARFDFDLRFPKMPSYLRRVRNPACIGKCIFLRNTDGSVGKSQEKKQGNPDWRMRIMPCLFFIVMSCTERKKKEKTKHT